MDLFLNNKVAMISGSSTGIGFHIAKDLAAEGCNVMLNSRKEDSLKNAVDTINELDKGSAAYFVGDVTDIGVADLFLQATLQNFGGVDILVNNVGGHKHKLLLETTDEDWYEAFNLNLFHAVRLARIVIPEIKKRGGGSILNIASIAGRESGGVMTYNAAKAALISFSKALAEQTAKDHIRVNSLAPGSILFPGGVWERIRKESPDDLRSYVETTLPLGRFGRPEEISAVAVFVVSPRASLVHGSCWNVDGGQSRSNI